MKRLILLAPPAASLFACSPGAVSLQPGMWETTVQVSSIDSPGAPPAELAQMRALLSGPQTHSECMTPEQAADPTHKMMNPPSNGNACQFGESTFAGGTIRVRSTCQVPGRSTTVTNMEGSYTATTMQATVSSEARPPPRTPGPQLVRMTRTISARRTGDCPR